MMSPQAKLEEQAGPAELRAELMRMLALGFMHPDAQFHEQICSGSYQSWLNQLTLAYIGEPAGLVTVDVCATDFEAGYIGLFHTGMPGSKSIGLHAGDHDDMLDGRGRPEFMLDYVNWYKHFGLQVHHGSTTSELPDHLVCQFEFLAWLAGLEATPGHSSELTSGYRSAQHDFLNLQLLPFLNLLQEALAGVDEIPVTFYQTILEFAVAICKKGRIECHQSR